MADRIERAYTLVAGDKPLLAFAAKSYREAQELTREAWLRDDLKRLTSYDEPLWDGAAKLSVREASGNEMSLLWQAAEKAVPDGDIVLAYLVELDGD